MCRKDSHMPRFQPVIINHFESNYYFFVGVTIVSVNLDWTLFIKSRIGQNRLNSP